MASLNQTRVFRLIFLLGFGTAKATYYNDLPSIQCRPLKFVPSSYSFSERDDPREDIPNLALYCDVPTSKTTASIDFYDDIMKAGNQTVGVLLTRCVMMMSSYIATAVIHMSVSIFGSKKS